MYRCISVDPSPDGASLMRQPPTYPLGEFPGDLDDDGSEPNGRLGKPHAGSLGRGCLGRDPDGIRDRHAELTI